MYENGCLLKDMDVLNKDGLFIKMFYDSKIRLLKIYEKVCEQIVLHAFLNEVGSKKWLYLMSLLVKR